MEQSFMDRSLCFLHRRCPSQTSHFSMQFLHRTVLSKLSTTVLMSHNVSEQSSSLQCDNIHQSTVSGILLLCSQVVSWLPESQPFAVCFSAKVCDCGQHLSQTLYGRLLAIGVCSHCKGSTSAEWSQEGPIYCGPLIGQQGAVLEDVGPY